MLRRRVIPCLDVADGRVVKGTTSSISSTKATRRSSPSATPPRAPTSSSSSTSRPRPERRGTLLDLVERTARRAFIPLTVGGGVRTVTEMRDVLRAGADKVSLNTAAVADPTLIGRCAGRFGRQAVVVAIDARAVDDRTPGRSWSRAVARRPGSMPSPGPNGRSSSAPASCW